MNRKANLIKSVVAEVVDPEKVVAHPYDEFKNNILSLVGQLSEEDYHDNEEAFHQFEKLLKDIVTGKMREEPPVEASTEEVTAALPRKTSKSWILSVEPGKTAIVVQGRDMGLVYQKTGEGWKPTTQYNLPLAADTFRAYQQKKAGN
jgi:hypothetical protein